MSAPLRVALNGFGRIGRSVLRILSQNRTSTGIEIALINDIAPLETCAYLFEYDSIFGVYSGLVSSTTNTLHVDGTPIPFTQTDDLSTLDLSGIDIVIECTGKANDHDFARRGQGAGARKILIAGPSEAAEVTLVLGANEDALGDQTIVSNASCTTNALAPLLKRLDAQWGLQNAHMTTIHCYTGSQPMVDGPRGDLARSRAGALSMVPTTTSATRLIGAVLPDLAPRLTGAAVRVPTASVSAVDLIATLRDAPNANTIAAFFRTGADHIIGVTEKPLVSTDLRARAESLIVATPEIQCGPNGQTRIFGWYDNEWGYANRVIDLALRMA